MMYSLFIRHAQLLRRCFSSKTPIFPYQNENLHFSATKLSRDVWVMVFWCTGTTSTRDTNNSKSVSWQCPLRSGSTVNYFRKEMYVWIVGHWVVLSNKQSYWNAFKKSAFSCPGKVWMHAIIYLVKYDRNSTNICKY